MAFPSKTLEELAASGSSLVRRHRARGKAEPVRRNPIWDRPRPRTPSVKEVEALCRRTDLLGGYDPWRDAKGYRFDAKVAHKEVEWFHQHITHVRGPLGGKAFELTDWEAALWGNLFGWFDAEGLRRYRVLYLYIPEKQGKTPLAAAIAIRLGEDQEPGFEIYSVAYNRDQARLVWDWAKGMIRNDEELSESWRVYTASMVRTEDTLACYKTIAAVDEGVHGANVHGGIIDEEHAFTQGKQGVVEVLESKTAARSQPLIVKISTAGYDRESICYRDWSYARRVRDGEEGFRNPRHFPVIFEAPAEADWTEPAVWAACNPNIGKSVKLDVYTDACERAKKDARLENLFRQLKLNQWTEQAVRYLPMDAWDRCPRQEVRLEDYFGQVAWIGFDGALTEDLTALSMILRGDDRYVLKSWAWIPEDTARERQEQDRVPYLDWAKKGIVELTPGDTTDWRYVERKLEWLASKFQVPKLVYDPAKARQWAIQVSDRLGIEFQELPQTAVKLNEATETFKRLVLEGRLLHGADPCLRWQASNCELKKRSDDLCQLGKPARNLRIDGIVAGVMALWLAIADEGVSMYETQGPGLAVSRNDWDQPLELIDD